ncbi:smoothelin, like isoform X2 [Amia ocellicauda]|uniref:smoothelin, like isoform X2 n=1 Tax=Amia ocellicauda TaxID=2972642 RepID=UPI0034642883
MDASELTGLDGTEAQTVCEALGRYETTLRDAVREIHVDISIFKQGVERRVDETLRLVSPLGRAVAELQHDNRQLRIQLETLTRQVELLMAAAHDRGVGQSPSTPEATQPPASSPQPLSSNSGSQQPMATLNSARFSSSATFAVSSKSNSIDREEPIEVDAAAANRVVENGHQASSESSHGLQEVRSPPPPATNNAPQEHTPSVAIRRPHLPITAMKKTADPSAGALTKSPETPTAPVSRTLERAPPPLVTEPVSVAQSAVSNSQPVSVHESPSQSAAPLSPVKTWTASPVRTMGSSRATVSDKPVSMTTKPLSPLGYPVNNPPISDRAVDGAADPSMPKPGERRRELVRSQTLPRTMGAQARRAIFERLDSDPNRPKISDSKPKLKRSQSFGVSSASSIKQILLEWCRSKTIGYQKIDIQNFSSSWSDGMAFCALVHSFFPEEFDYNELNPVNRKENFEMAFSKAEERASCDRLIEVEDMMVMGRKPDPMCVFTYVQSLYNHLRRFE